MGSGPVPKMYRWVWAGKCSVAIHRKGQGAASWRLVFNLFFMQEEIFLNKGNLVLGCHHNNEILWTDRT